MVAVVDHFLHHGGALEPDQRLQRHRRRRPLNEWYAEHKRPRYSRSPEQEPGASPEREWVRSILLRPVLSAGAAAKFRLRPREFESGLLRPRHCRQLRQPCIGGSPARESGHTGPALSDRSRPFLGEYGDWQENTNS